MSTQSIAEQKPRQATARPPSARAEWVCVGMLILIVVAVFCPIVTHTFIEGDDQLAIADNPDFKPPTSASLGHYWTAPYLQFYVPVLYTTWWVIAHFAGGVGADGSYVLSAGPFHAASLVMHAVGAVAAYLVMRQLVRDRWAAWLGAAIFALHPLQVEAVAWASTLYSAMSGAFALLAMWAYFRYSDAVEAPAAPRAKRRREKQASPRGSGGLWLALAVAFFAVALLTKPTIILLPVILGLVDVVIRGRPLRRVMVPLDGMLVLGAIPIAIATQVAQPAVGTYSPVWMRPLVAGDALAFYLWKLVAPLHLYFDYGRSPRWLEQSGWILRLTWIVPVAVALLAAAFRRRTRWPLVATGVFVLALLPVLGFARFDYQRYSTVADRYAYFALFAPAMLVAVALASRVGRARTMSIALAVALVVTLGVLSHVQVRRWANDERFFAYIRSQNPTGLMVRIHEIQQLSNAGRTSEALDAYHAILQVEPRQPRVLYNLGNLCLRLKMWDEAIDSYTRSAEISGGDSRLFSNIGIAHAQAGRGEQALASLKRALEMNPADADAHLNMAIVLVGFGRVREAREHYNEVIKLNGNVTAARRGIAVIDSMR